MKHTYRIRVQPQRYHGLLYGLPPLAKESLTSAIENVVVREIVQGQHGDSFVDVQLQRPTHEEALNDVLVAIQQLGYSWLEATVTEWSDYTIGGGIAGFLGCGAAGSASGDDAVSLMLAVIGGVVGMVVGTLVRRVKVIYTVQWNGTSWVLTPITPAPAPVPATRPQFA